jgi:hypothetical protein
MYFNAYLLLAFSAYASAYNLPLNCAPNSGLMTTPTYGTTGAVFTVCAQNLINASPASIYDVLIDFPRYPLWNTFVYFVDVPAGVTSAEDVYVGMPMTFHSSGLLGGINSTSDERITYLEPNAASPFIGWEYNPGVIVGLATQAEHVSLLQDLGNGSTKYVSWETYYGVGSVVIAALKGSFWSWEVSLESKGLSNFAFVEQSLGKESC